MDERKENSSVWKSILKIILAVVLVFGLLVGVPFLVVMLWANSLDAKYEKMEPQVQEIAVAYIAEKYPGNDFEITNLYHNFKDNSFDVKVQSKSSADTHFTVKFADDTLEVDYDSYEFSVAKRGNTAERIVEDYETQATAVLETIPGYDWSEVSFVTYSQNTSNNLHFSPAGLDRTTLELDGEYDAAEMGWDYGWLSVYFLEEPENLNVPRVLERLRQVDEAMTKAGVGYQVVEIILITDTDLVKANTFEIYAIRREYLQSDDPLAVLQELWEEQEANRQAVKEQWAEAGED